MIKSKIIQRFSTNPKVFIFDPEFVICADDIYCPLYKDNEPMYFDYNHLSMAGSLLFTEKWKLILEQALDQTG